MTNGPLYDMIIDRSLGDMIYDHHDFFNPYFARLTDKLNFPFVIPRFGSGNPYLPVGGGSLLSKNRGR